jgi:hypothetical protein
MTTIPVIQPSFAAGELSPYLYGRVDLAKYRVGARTLLNFFVHPHGGASNRPGTRWIGEVDDSSRKHRLIPFQFRTLPAGQTYVLVFGHKTMQVAMFNGTAWGFVQNADGTLFTMATPYAETDLRLLKYVQSQDTLTLCHPNYAVRNLRRVAHNSWTLTPITFAPSTKAPTGLAAGSPGSAGFAVVTAINDSSGEESLPSAQAGTTSGTDTWSWTAVAGCSNYNVYKKKGSIFGFVAQVQTTTWTDATIDPDISTTPPGSRTPFGTGTLQGLTIQNGGSGYSGGATGELMDGIRAVTSVTLTVVGGVITAATATNIGLSVSANATVRITDGTGTGAVLTPTWSGPDENGYYTLTGASVTNGGSGYGANPTAGLTWDPNLASGNNPRLSLTVVGGAIASATLVSGSLIGPDYSLSTVSIAVVDSAGAGAVILANVLADGGNLNPACSSYFMQRQVYGDTLQQPQTLWFTGVGAFANMNVSTPTKDSDAITRTLTGQQVNEIRHLIPVGSSMLVMTSGAEWRCWPGPSSNALTPGACYTLPQTAHGSSHVPPVQAGNDVLFIKEKGSRVLALRFDAIQDQYQSFDMSVLAQHLLADTSGTHQIVEWAYATEPYQIIWAVRDDGVLLGFTYMREHDVYAWHRHVTDGLVESVATITEPDGYGGYEDAVYLIVNRTIGGQTKRYLERMVSRTFPTIADAWFVDCGLQYSGTPVTQISNLGYLEGKTVAILGDGSVVPSQVVTNGTVQLDGSYSKVIVGLLYTCDLETLNLELAPAGGTSQGQMKKISQVTIRAKETRGVKVGINQTVAQEVKQRQQENLGSPMQLFTGDYAVTVPSEWNRDGRIFVRQSYPLPCTILDLIPDVAPGR